MTEHPTTGHPTTVTLHDDGRALLAAFARLAASASEPEAAPETVLEAAAMGIALAELGLVAQASDRERLARQARKTLLSAAALRDRSDDEDARDALDLAIEQARRGALLLGGGALSLLDGAPTHEPTPHELLQLVRGELDGHAAADVALRLHRSGMRQRYAALLPSSAMAAAGRVRLAADSAPIVRDPSTGRSLGTQQLGAATLEAYAFEAGVVAIYAEPAIAISLVSIDTALVARAIEAAGYVELAVDPSTARVALVLADGDRSVGWTLALR